MRYSLAAIVFALFGHSVVATPVTPDLAAIGASLPVVQLGPPSAASVSLPLSSLRNNTTLRADAIDPILLLCSGTNCQACNVFDMVDLLTDTCFPAGLTFVSAAYVVTNQLGLSFTPSVGTSGCASILELPTPNTCFNINGGTFNTFALLN
ncbi:hypothetical protein TRAPUB_530 [Trametes pubescens]|uniref:Hydrophobin n=1 Tax=Trametes pubescens TaxID=154538 RepID=A0A1M2VM10_TRAPU|nr:hypothetical protein TRAPUB_530 [Trametes pubescens]